MAFCPIDSCCLFGTGRQIFGCDFCCGSVVVPADDCLPFSPKKILLGSRQACLGSLQFLCSLEGCPRRALLAMPRDHPGI